MLLDPCVLSADCLRSVVRETTMWIVKVSWEHPEHCLSMLSMSRWQAVCFIVLCAAVRRGSGRVARDGSAFVNVNERRVGMSNQRHRK
jgi:hypothetical protein